MEYLLFRFRERYWIRRVLRVQKVRYAYMSCFAFLVDSTDRVLW